MPHEHGPFNFFLSLMGQTTHRPPQPFKKNALSVEPKIQPLVSLEKRGSFLFYLKNYF
jgi:hypothetical protein